MDVQYDSDGRPFIMWGENKFQLELDPVTDDFFIQKARNELRETPENVEKGVRELRELLKAETSLHVPLDDDKFLIKWLRLCKFYPESAFKKIQTHFKFRKDHPEYWENLKPSVEKNAIVESALSLVSPRDQQGRRTLVVESGHRWDPNVVSLKEFIRAIHLSMEVVALEPKTQIAGLVIIMDLKDMALKHVVQFTPSLAKTMVELMQDANVIRNKAIHIINQPYLFNMVFALFKPFFREKLRNRIIMHGTDLKSFHAHVDPKCLRARHGGQLPDPEAPGTAMWKIVSPYEDIFDNYNKYGYASTSSKKSKN